MNDEPLYQDANGNTVTRSRAIMGGTTYPIANITSVSASQKGGGPIIAICIGVIGVAVCFSSAIVGFILLFLALFAYLKGKPVATVMIGTAAGEKSALQSSNPEVIRNIVSALNQAIDSR